MENLSLKILTVGDRKAPVGWHVSQKVKIQRLYYIKGGSGSVADGHGGRLPFEKGKIYILPYNLEADLVNDPLDPIDHVYYDFLSTPPIISNEPIVYEPDEGSTAMMLIHATESFCRELLGHNATERQYYSPQFKLDNDSNCRQIFKSLLSTVIMTLSFEKAIPFSEDAVIVEALDTIRKNYMKPISVNELAAEAGFEVHYFIRRFKQIMGMTPYKYLRSYRLIKAAELIEGSMSITEASELVGYESPTALSRSLKRDGLK